MIQKWIVYMYLSHECRVRKFADDLSSVQPNQTDLPNIPVGGQIGIRCCMHAENPISQIHRPV